jgi:dynein heavy chain, axonemal
VSYCGPFNQEFRTYMVADKFTHDLSKNSIPFTVNLDIIPFLVDIGTIGDWNMQVTAQPQTIVVYDF